MSLDPKNHNVGICLRGPILEYRRIVAIQIILQHPSKNTAADTLIEQGHSNPPVRRSIGHQIITPAVSRNGSDLRVDSVCPEMVPDADDSREQPVTAGLGLGLTDGAYENAVEVYQEFVRRLCAIETTITLQTLHQPSHSK